MEESSLCKTYIDENGLIVKETRIGKVVRIEKFNQDFVPGSSATPPLKKTDLDEGDKEVIDIDEEDEKEEEGDVDKGLSDPVEIPEETEEEKEVEDEIEKELKNILKFIKKGAIIKAKKKEDKNQWAEKEWKMKEYVNLETDPTGYFLNTDEARKYISDQFKYNSDRWIQVDKNNWTSTDGQYQAKIFVYNNKKNILVKFKPREFKWSEVEASSYANYLLMIARTPEELRICLGNFGGV